MRPSARSSIGRSDGKPEALSQSRRATPLRPIGSARQLIAVIDCREKCNRVCAHRIIRAARDDARTGIVVNASLAAVDNASGPDFAKASRRFAKDLRLEIIRARTAQ